MTLERPEACPKPGVVEAFDAGWDAHEVGIERATVEVFTPASGRGWALLGWDARQLMQVRADLAN